MPNESVGENDAIMEMHHIGNYKEFSCIDNSLPCYNKYESYEETVVEEIAMKHR
jgi:hypothetical protein